MPCNLTPTSLAFHGCGAIATLGLPDFSWPYRVPHLSFLTLYPSVMLFGPDSCFHFLIIRISGIVIYDVVGSVTSTYLAPTILGIS